MTDFLQHLFHEFQLPLKNPVLIFSLILFIILLAPILLRKINVPGIIGLIVSGIIIGPYGFHILGKTDAIQLFSTIGLLYIMFIAGLELDLAEFRVNRNKSFLFGFYTFIIPLSIGFPVCYYFLGYGVSASLLIASMFSTHTLVAYPIVSKLGVAKNKAVAIAVGGTILTDTAVLIILAVIVGNHEGGLNFAFWLRLGVSYSSFSFIVFYLIPKVSRWFFQRLEGEKHAHYIYVLSVLFFSAFLAEVAGLEPIIGAFAAGLALNSQIPHSSALMNRIEFIGNSLFIPFFLISVGMIVDTRILLSNYFVWIAIGTLTTVALFGKWLAAAITQHTFRFSRTQRQLIFGLSSSHAAATLAIILVGFRANILDETILNGTIILILITCIVSSFATERAAKKLAIEQDDHHSATPNKASFREHILIPVSKLSLAEKMVEFASLIKDKKAIHPLTLVSVIPFDNDAEFLLKNRQIALDKFAFQASGSEVKVNTVVTIDHTAIGGIVRSSRELLADIVLLEWTQKSIESEKLFSERIEAIVERTNAALFACKLTRPLVSHERILWVVSPLAEKEIGFDLIFQKVLRISQELSIPIQPIADQRSLDTLQSMFEMYEYSLLKKPLLNENWESDFSLNEKYEDGLIIITGSRKGSLSYQNSHPKWSLNLAQENQGNNLLLFYPSTEDAGSLTQDFNLAPIAKGIEQIEQISKNIGQIFKGSKSQEGQ